MARPLSLDAIFSFVIVNIIVSSTNSTWYRKSDKI